MSYLDARDLYDELNDLRERQEVIDQRDAETDILAEYVDAEPLDEDEAERLKALEELADEIGEDTMRYGETMIPVDDFEDYARQTAEETIPNFDRRSNDWPFNCIDWTEAAENLSQDYTEVEFDGVDYYVRVS